MIEIGEPQIMGDARVVVTADRATSSLYVKVELWREKEDALIPTSDVDALAFDDTGAPLKPIRIRRADHLLEFRSTAYAHFDFELPPSGHELAKIEIRYRGHRAVFASRPAG